MKTSASNSKNLVIIAGLIFSLAACREKEYSYSKETNVENRENIVNIPSDKKAPVISTPAPTPPPVAPEKPKENVRATIKKLAPDGIFFLRIKKSVETDSGVTGIPPGTKIILIGNNKYKTDNGEILELLPAEITNDIDEVTKIIGFDRYSQSIIKQKLATPAPTPVIVINPTTPTPTPEIRPNNPSVSNLSGSFRKTSEGWIWEKDRAGKWIKVRPIRAAKD